VCAQHRLALRTMSHKIDLIGKVDERNWRRFHPVLPTGTLDRTGTVLQRFSARLPITSHAEDAASKSIPRGRSPVLALTGHPDCFFLRAAVLLAADAA
jgi:hypothetical protein